MNEDELIEEYREGYAHGEKERRESDKRNLVEGLAHEVADLGLMVGTMGLSHLHELGRSEAFKAGQLAGRRGEPCAPHDYAEGIQQAEEAENAARKRREEAEENARREAARRSEPARESSDDPTEGLIKLALWLGAIVFVLWLVFMAIAITVMLAPIWLGATTAGVVTGFLLAPHVLRRIPAEIISQAPIFEEKLRKRSRLRLSGEFIKSAARITPDILTLVGVTLLFGVAMSAWPVLSTPDTLTRILLGAGVLAGTILGTLAGRRVLHWQMENLVFAGANLKNPTHLVAPKIALGFSIPSLILLAGGWTLSLVQSREPVNFGKALGINSTHTSRSTASTGEHLDNSRSTPATTLPHVNSEPLPTNLGPGVASMTLPEGFSIPQGTLSPDGRYGVLVPDYRHFREGVRAQNKLVNAQSGAEIAAINAESWFQDSAHSMNHGSAAARWSNDGSALAWVVGGKWAPRAFNLFKLSEGNVSWQMDVLAKVQQEILRQTRSAAPDAYEFARDENRGSGSAYPDGFVIDVQVPDAAFSFPLQCSVTLDSNPKEIVDKKSLRSSLRAIIQADGRIEFSGFALHSGGAPTSITQNDDGVREFIRQRVEVERSHNLDRILENYANRVNFWDNGIVDRDFIRNDKSTYFERWPVTNEEVVGEINVSRNGDEWIANFRTNFRVENTAKGVSIHGVQESTYSMRYLDGRFRIVAENGNVLQKEKQETTDQVASGIQESVESKAMPGERFPDTSCSVA